MPLEKKIVYCHCQYARVITPEVKQEVLNGLAHHDQDFHAVPDLCEMASRKDPLLQKLAQNDSLQIVACYPRAVKALFHQAGTQLNENVQILNMREDSAETILHNIGIAPVKQLSVDKGEN